MSKKRQWEGRVFLGRDENGRQRFWWCGRWPTKRERDAAVAKARTEKPWEKTPVQALTCDQWADRYVARYQRMVDRRERKASSLDTARLALKRFRAEFGARDLISITHIEAEDWADTVPKAILPVIVSMFNYAVRMQVLDRNPFAGLGGGQGRGRADENPPTPEQMDALLDACSALEAYGPQMRALIVFAAYTGMRPSELFELRWQDIDLAASRIAVSRRLYRGSVDSPKGNRAKTIALPPPARDALLSQPTRAGELVFVSKTGKRLTASTVCQYWAVVRAAAGLDSTYDLYRCTKHYGVHLLYRLGLSRRAIASQMGWQERAVDALLHTYGHADLVALAEIDALYASESRARVSLDVTQEAPDVP